MRTVMFRSPLWLVFDDSTLTQLFKRQGHSIRGSKFRVTDYFLSAAGLGACLSEAGRAKSESGIGTFTSIFSAVNVCAPGLLLVPVADENGYITPLTGL